MYRFSTPSAPSVSQRAAGNALLLRYLYNIPALMHTCSSSAVTARCVTDPEHHTLQPGTQAG